MYFFLILRGGLLGVEQRVSIKLDYNPLGDSGGDGNEAVVVR